MTRVMSATPWCSRTNGCCAQNQFFERYESQLRQASARLPEARGSQTPTVDANAEASALNAFAIGACTASRGRGSVAARPTPRRRAGFVRRRLTMTTTVLAGGRPITLLPSARRGSATAARCVVADVHIARRRRFRSLGVPVRTNDRRDARGARAPRDRRAPPRRLPRRLPALAEVARRSDRRALARWRKATSGAHRPGARARQPRARAATPPPYLDIDVVPRPYFVEATAPWRCAITRGRTAAPTSLAGHLHPCVAISGARANTCDYRCFWLGDDVGVLPAFGASLACSRSLPPTSRSLSSPSPTTP